MTQSDLALFQGSSHFLPVIPEIQWGMPYMIQERFVLRRIAAGVVTETPYFSPDLDTIEVLTGVPGGTICIAESSRTGFEAGAPVRAIILLDPCAWRFKMGETEHAYDRHQIACGIVRKVDSSF